jgi:hypothetical protein
LVTDVVTWEIQVSSSNPAVVRPDYASGVWAVQSGEAVITAVDRNTGISSADSGHTAMTVVGPTRLRVADRRPRRRSPFQFTAHGSTPPGARSTSPKTSRGRRLSRRSRPPATSSATRAASMLAEGTTIIAFDRRSRCRRP